MKSCTNGGLDPDPPMYRIGRFVFQRRVRPFPVIDTQRLRHHFARLPEICRPIEQELAFQNAIDAFGQRMLITVVAICHGASQPVTTMNFLLVSKVILDAPT